MLPPPPLVPPGIGVAPGGRASSAAPLSLEEEVRAAERAALARGRGHQPPDRRDAPLVREYASERSRAVNIDIDGAPAPAREYASERSRAVDMDIDGSPANLSQPPHLRNPPVQPNGIPRINVPVRVVAPDRVSAEREFASDRTRAALSQEAPQRERASERGRPADRGHHAAAEEPRANGRADGAADAQARLARMERAIGHRPGAVAEIAVKAADERPAEGRNAGGGPRRGQGHGEQQRRESSGELQPEKKGGWGSWMRERLRGSSRDRVVDAGDRRDESRDGDRHRHVSEQRERPERGPSLSEQRIADGGGGPEHGADRGRSAEGRRASGEASARHGASSASPHGSAAARYLDDVREWWYTDPKVGGGNFRPRRII